MSYWCWQLYVVVKERERAVLKCFWSSLIPQFWSSVLLMALLSNVTFCLMSFSDSYHFTGCYYAKNIHREAKVVADILDIPVAIFGGKKDDMVAEKIRKLPSYMVSAFEFRLDLTSNVHFCSLCLVQHWYNSALEQWVKISFLTLWRTSDTLRPTVRDKRPVFGFDRFLTPVKTIAVLVNFKYLLLLFWIDPYRARKMSITITLTS